MFDRPLPRRRYSKQLKMIGVAFALVFGLLLMPARAQSDRHAAVTIDGRQIFRVASSEQLTASDRADWINERLQGAIASRETPNVRVELRNRVPTIILNDRYLLTVTQDDSIGEKNPSDQATIWVERIREAIDRAQRERGAKFVKQTVLFAVGIISIAIALHWLSGKLWVRVHRRINRINRMRDPETNNQSQTITLLFNTTLLLERTALWIGTFFYVTNLFPLTRQWSYAITSSVIASLSAPIFSPGGRSYSITDLLLLTGLLLAVIFLSGSATNLVRTRILQAMRLSRGAEATISALVKYTLISVGAIVLLQLWGLDLSSLAILASALGIGIGFGLQNIARDFGSGLILLFERPIQIGDFIEVGEYEGTVEHIGTRSTVIRTLDRISIIVPNSQFLEKEVINWSHLNPISRLHLPVGVAYRSDVNSVKSALLEAARNHPEVLSSPAPQVLFKGFGHSALNFDLLVWISIPERQLLIKSDLYFLIKASLQKYQIEIPYPQQDLHVRSGGIPIQLSPEIEQALLHLSRGVNGKQKSNREDRGDRV